MQKTTKTKSKCSKFISCILTTFDEYSGVSSITGLKYAKGSNTNLPIKIFWCVVILLSFIFCNILVAHFWLRYKSNSTRMTVASDHVPLSALQLPAITFCPVKHLDVNRSKTFIDKLTINRQEVFRLLPQTYGWFQNNAYNLTELEMLQRILESNNSTINDFMSAIQRPCDQLLVKCRYEQSIIPCSNLFNVSSTQYGNCCSFNRNQELNNSNFIEPKNTLSLIISPDHTTTLDSEGIKLLIHESGTSAGAFSTEKILPLETDVSIRIVTVVNTCSVHVSKLSITERNCLHQWERKLRHFSQYREINCKVECILKIIVRLCNCLPYYYEEYARNESHQICNFTQITCLVDNYWKITGNRKNYSLECDCMPNCDDYSYEITSSQVRLHQNPNYCIDPFYSDLKDNHMVVHISFGSQVFKMMQKDLATNILALTANLGGIYSLFIGFSAITFIEIIYYFCVRFYINYRKN